MLHAPMKEGTYSPDHLPGLAREAHAASGLTQSDAAARLGVTPQSYGQALSDRAGLDVLRRRIIEAFTDYDVTGPVFHLVNRSA